MGTPAKSIGLPAELLLVKEIVDKGLIQPSPLLFILHSLQDQLGYVSEDAIYQISASLNVPTPEVLSVVTFHRQFKLKLKHEPEIARNVIKVCSGTACYVKGAQMILDKLSGLLEIQKGEITKDKRFGLETVDCLGTCSMAPAIIINDDIFGSVEVGQLAGFLENYN